MKFLNKIDGADKIVTDANNRLVTDVKIAEWDSKANGAHEHSTSDITDFPTSLPANGGNSDTVNGLTVQTAVPLNAKFTDTITTVNGKTGAISKADIVALGIPSQDTVVDISGKADKTYVDNKVKTDVPSDAVFTDTIYTHPSTHPASMITESTTKRFVSDAEKTTWNNKANASDIPNKFVHVGTSQPTNNQMGWIDTSL